MAFITCWNCNGNGLIVYPYQPLERCEKCKGTGCNYELTKNTKVILEQEKNYPSPLPKFK